MQTAKTLGITFITALLALVLGACNNLFHDLIPQTGDRILSFTVPEQIGDAVIGENTVELYVSKDANIHELMPSIAISKNADIFPLTLQYLQATFPSADIFKAAIDLYLTDDFATYVENLIRENKADFNVPALNMTIDFTRPVDFLVVAAAGNMRRYTVTVVRDTGEPRMVSFGFAKYDNPELMSDARALIVETTGVIVMQAMYPAEMPLSYKLIPSFDILGESVEVDGVEIISGEDFIQFNAVLNTPQTKTITVWRDGLHKNYTLMITFAEDKDTIRSITDFRFNKDDNDIELTSVAAIVNTEDAGTITAQVYYIGTKPTTLTPTFLSPGTVSVAGATQISGTSSHDFSAPVEYLVVSKNGQYRRTYTVNVEFYSLTEDTPRILAFKFSQSINGSLIQDNAGQINDGFGDSDGLIVIDARYSTSSAPAALIPEFTADGVVSVGGSVQVSGASAQDFSRHIKYTVTNPAAPLLKRDYWVQTNLIHDTSSDASITKFSFHPDENKMLDDEIVAKIDQSNNTIHLFPALGSSVTENIMFPRFTSNGTVSVNGTVQTSPQSGQMFDVPLVYTVVSANGKNTREYTVTVQEMRTRIYVCKTATGANDGTTWENAFTSLNDACNAAATEFPEYVPKEIWIAAGTYTPNNYFPITSNTSYIGGFAGTETAKSQRDVAANEVIVTGGYNVRCLFYDFYANSKGDILFENLDLYDAPLGIQLGSSGVDVTIKNLKVFNITSSPAVGVATDGNVTIDTVTIDTVTNGIGLYINSAGTTQIINSVIINCTTPQTGGGMFIFGSGDAQITDTILEDCVGGGIHNNQSGNFTVERVELRGIVGGGISSRGSGKLIVNDVVLENITGQAIYKMYGGADLDNITISNVRGSDAIYVDAGNEAVTMDHVNIDGVSNGRGIRIISNGSTAKITNSVVKNCNAIEDFGGGIHFSGGGELVVANSQFENCLAEVAGAIYCYSLSLAPITCELAANEFINCTAQRGALIMYSAAFPIVKDCTFTHNENLVDMGYPFGIHVAYVFGTSSVINFENCKFNNLKGNNAGENYLFCRYSGYPGTPGYTYGGFYDAGEFTLQNCIINLDANSAGIAALCVGFPGVGSIYPDSLLMDGVVINDSGLKQPILWLSGDNPIGTFQFKDNNIYNGKSLEEEIIRLGTSLVRIDNGANIWWVP